MFETFRVDRPYPGLRPFEAWESSIFFGRESHTDKLLEILDAQHFLVVTGPSGSGKSSLVRAGLIPGLHLGTIGRGGAWKLALMRPGDRPLRELAQALLGREGFGADRSAAADSTGSSASGAPHATDSDMAHDTAHDTSQDTAQLREQAYLQAELARGRRGLADWVRERRNHGPSKDFDLLLLVDQFEEIFTHAKAGSRAANEAEAFVNLLLSAAQESDSGIYVVLTMRTDFLGACTRFPDLPEAINRAGYLTPRLSRAQLEQAIAAPARVFGGDLDADLTTELVNAVSEDPDQLPVLQHALARMWDCRCVVEKATPRLQVGDLRDVGGIGEALSRHAGEVLQALQGDPALPHAEAMLLRAQWLFRALSERRGAESGGQLVRHPQALSLIAQASGISWHDFVPLLQAYAQAEVSFLTYPGQPGEPANGADTVVDISHEALLRQWTQLKDWLGAEARAAAELRELLRRVEQKDTLLSGQDLARALDWQRRGLGLRKLAPEAAPFGAPSAEWAQRYCDASAYVAVMQLIADSQLYLQHQTRRARRITWTLRGGAVLLFVLGVASGGFGYWAYRQTLDASALAMWNRLRFDEDNGNGEDLTQSVLQLARSDRELRRVSARKWLDDEALARQIPRSNGIILRAALGLDGALRDELVNGIVARVPTAPPAMQAAIAYALISLDAGLRPDLVFKALVDSGDPYAFQSEAFWNYFSHLSPQASRTFMAGLETMGRAASPAASTASAGQAATVPIAPPAASAPMTAQGAIAVLAPLLLQSTLSDEQARNATRMVLELLVQTQDPNSAAVIANLARSTASKLTPAQRAQYIELVQLSAGDGQQPAQVMAMAAALAPVAGKLSAGQMQIYVSQVLTAMARADGARGRPPSMSFMAAIGSYVSGEQATALLGRVVTMVIEEETGAYGPTPPPDPSRGAQVEQAFEFAHALPAVEARLLIERLLASVPRQDEDAWLSSKSSGLVAGLTNALATDAMQDLATKLIERLSKPHHSRIELQAEAMLLAGFDRLSDAQAAWVTELMLRNVERLFSAAAPIDMRTYRPRVLSQRQSERVIDLSRAAQAPAQVAERIYAVLAKREYVIGSAALARRMAALVPLLDAPTVASLTARVMQRWIALTDSNRYVSDEWHLIVLVALCSRQPEAALTDDFIRRNSELALDASGSIQEQHADALIALVAALPDARSAGVVDQVVGEIATLPYAGTAWQSGERLTALINQTTPDAARARVLSLLNKLGTTRSSLASYLLTGAAREASLQLPAVERKTLAHQLLQGVEGPGTAVVRANHAALASLLSDSAQIRPDEIRTWLELCKSPFADRAAIVRALRQAEDGGPEVAAGDWAYLAWSAQRHGVDVRSPMHLGLAPLSPPPPPPPPPR